jgi:hypothetical protein
LGVTSPHLRSLRLWWAWCQPASRRWTESAAWSDSNGCFGIALLFWLPDRPLPPGEVRSRSGWRKFIPQSKPALTGEDARIHYEDLTRVYSRQMWTMKDIWHILIDWRLYPLVIMYFGVVGVGNGVQAYATVIIRGINPKLTGIQLSLLSAPIWLVGSSLLIGTFN